MSEEDPPSGRRLFCQRREMADEKVRIGLRHEGDVEGDRSCAVPRPSRASRTLLIGAAAAEAPRQTKSQTPPALSEEQILAWADAYFAENGKWPTPQSGPIADTGETTFAVQVALTHGRRGIGPGSSLRLLLAERRGAEHVLFLPRLTEEQILGWADAYFAENGKWPGVLSGPIAGTRESWNSIERALNKGGRGLAGRSSLRQLLAERRGARNPCDFSR